MSAIQNQLQQGAVPNSISNVCPQGTKFHVLEVGWYECDEGFVVRGGNSSLKSNEGEAFDDKRRQMPMYCILVEHLHEGLILWETGCGKDYPHVWGPDISDIFARVQYEPQHELRAAVEATGNKIEDIKMIIIGHLHLDHAGGLNEFAGADVGVYLPHYLDLSLYTALLSSFTTFDFCQGITLHHLPGHTDGLIGMQINMPETGTFFFISDHCHVIENWQEGIPQGWLARDHPSWFRSTQRLKHLERITKGQVIPGHDKETFPGAAETGENIHLVLV
ncbi:hypothetical protein BBP40_005739 [Aspergillus hancockii]|nr:hypothetical protein BBP40_005739 [Aspergillus hancockii]